MDRAHRLGQTRTVNVYRLLMRNTIEEKVGGRGRHIGRPHSLSRSLPSFFLAPPPPLARCFLALAPTPVPSHPAPLCNLHPPFPSSPLLPPSQVMGLQQFKIDMANAVVNQENMSLKEMDTTQLLDLFGSGSGKPGGPGQGGAAAGGASAEEAAAAASKKQGGLQAVLSTLGELWDENQYSSEFSMETFMGKLGGAGKAE
jgi:hypothetical protein